MRIEEVTKTKLSKASDKELLVLKLRFTQLWDKNFKNNDDVVVGSLNRNKFLKNYKLLLTEMNSRKIEKSTSAIDKAVFKKAMVKNKFGIDVSDLEDIVLIEDHVFIDAADVNSEKLDAITKAAQSGFVETTKEKCKEPDAAYIPLYDLVLKAKQETVIIEVSKPYPNEHSARLQDPTKFEPKSFRRTKGGVLYGSKKIPNTISIIWGKLENKAKPTDPPIAQALRFPIKNWTATEAKKWLADNNIKYILFEPAKTVAKKLLTTEAAKNDAPEKVKDTVSKAEKFISVYPIDKADAKSKDEHIVCGIVYEPDVEDAQGDAADETEIRKAAHYFMENSQQFKIMHKGSRASVKVLESYLAPVNFTISGQKIRKGTWIIKARILDKETWEAVKNGSLKGFSMAGFADMQE